jgi:hypothetical protein
VQSLGIISEAELELVCALAYVNWPGEQNNEGVMVHVHNGRRVWNSGDRNVAIQVIGDAASFSGSHIIPLRFIRECDNLANLEAEVELFVQDGFVFSKSEHSHSQMQLGTMKPTIIEDANSYTTTASISGVGFKYLIDFGTLTPVQYLNESESHSVPNLSTIIFGDKTLGIRSEFREVGCRTACPHWEAEIAGTTGEVAVDRIMLRRLFTFMAESKLGAIPVRLTTDLVGGNFLQISSENWTIQFSHLPTGAARYYQELTGRLNDLGLNVEEDEDGKVCVEISDCNVVMQLLDGRVPVMRSVIELISGVESTPDLLHEIQQQNEGRIFTKYFMSDDSVFACTDIRCSDLHHLEDHLRGFVNDSELLGSYLASLGVSGGGLSLH